MKKSDATGVCEDDASDPLWQLPVEMARLAIDTREPTSEQVEALRAYLDLRVISFRESDADGRLMPSAQPGYLETTASGRRVLVPFQLGPFFPSDEVLGPVVQIAEGVALDTGNPICISGSLTLLSAVREIGDLDYCEYHLARPYVLAERITEKVDAGAAELPLVEVKCGRKLHHPWEELGDALAAALRLEAAEGEAPPIKLDFVSNTDLGLFPTTSLVLALGADREAGNADESFTYQEAVICDDHAPRSLVRPESIGEYLKFLIENSRSWLQSESGASEKKRATKALKRLLSAALLMGETRLVESVVDGLAHPAVAEVTIRLRVEELHELLSYMPEGSAAPLRAKVDAQAASLQFSTEALAMAVEELLEIGQTVLDEVELLLGETGDDL